MPPMTPTRQNTTVPSLAWLDRWATDLPEVPDDSDVPGKPYLRDRLAKQHLSGIRRLLSDAHVRGRLSRYSSHATHEAIKTLLAESSWACAALTENNRNSLLSTILA